jgi:hypothetical protein
MVLLISDPWHRLKGHAMRKGVKGALFRAPLVVVLVDGLDVELEALRRAENTAERTGTAPIATSHVQRKEGAAQLDGFALYALRTTTLRRDLEGRLRHSPTQPRAIQPRQNTTPSSNTASNIFTASLGIIGKAPNAPLL